MKHFLWNLVLNYPAAQQSSNHSKRNRWRTLALAGLALVAMAASALGGAWAHARFYNDAPALTPESERALINQASRDAAYIRESVNLLADKVGTLQAKIIAVNGLGRRVAQAAGVPYTEPELHDNLPLFDIDGINADAAPPGGSVTAPPHGNARESVMDFIEPASFQHYTGSDMSGNTYSMAEELGRRLDALHEQLAAQEDGLTLLDLMLTRRTGIDASLPSVMPVDYPYLSSSFGWRRNPVTGRHSMHEGLDFAAPSGSPIYATSAGVVTQARYRSGYGNLVEIAHGNGLSTRYAHASSIKVKEGDLVEKGQMIALVGSTGRSTGAHLHFEVRMAGHPLDPTLFLPPPAPEPLIADAGEHIPTTGAQVR